MIDYKKSIKNILLIITLLLLWFTSLGSIQIVKAYDSTFSVTIPKDIVLDGNAKSASYSVNVKGNVESGESAVVSVTPSSSFTLTNVVASGYPSKSDISAQITQDAISWSYSDIMNGVTTNGKIVANGISAGSWNGNFNFNISFEVNSMIVNVTNGIATYTGSTTDGGAKVVVTYPESDVTIKYGTKEGTYDLTSIPTYTNVGTYKIYYQVTADNYAAKTGSFTITINGADGSMVAPTARSLTYTGSAQALINAGSSSTGTMQYKLGDDGEYSTSIPTATNAGTYTVYYKVVGDANHEDVEEASISVTIAAKAMTVSTTNGNATYSGSATNGGASVNVTTPSSGYTIKYGTANGSYTLTSIPTYTNVGTYTIYYQVTASNYTTKTGSFIITIAKANGSVTAPTAKSLTYTGSAQALVNAGSSSTGEIQYKLGESGTYSTTIPTATNAGSYTVYYKVVGDSNHNDVSEASVNVTIATKAITASTVNGSATYSGISTNGGAKVNVTTPSSGYTIKYGTKEGTYDLTSIPTYTNAGTYTIYYQVTADNYTTKTGNFTITISKANGSVTAPTAKSLTYNGSSQALINAGSSTTGTIQYKLDNGAYSTSIPVATNAGTYLVYYKVVGDSNHNDVSEASINVTIATKLMSVTATNGSATYSGSATNGGAKVSVTTPSSGYTIKYGTKEGTYDLTSIPTYTNAGTYTIYFQVTADNYTTKTGSFEIEIEKAEHNVVDPTPITGQIDVDAPGYYLVKEGSCTTGTIYYSIDNVNYSKDVPIVGGAGRYLVYYKVYEDENHYEFFDYVEVTILSKSDMEVESIDGYATYNGKATNGGAKVSVTTPSSGYTIKYGTKEDTYDLTSIPTYTNAGTYTIYYEVTATGYNDYTGSFEIEIEKAEHDVIEPTPITGQVFCDAPSYSLVKAGSCSTGTIFYSLDNKNYSTETPDVYFSGTYTVYYKVYEDENHYEYFGSVKVTINAMPGELEAPTAKNLTYNGEEQELVNAGSYSAGNVYYKLEGDSEFSTKIPTATNAGTYTIYYMGKGYNYNYEDTDVESIVVEIEKAEHDVIDPTPITGQIDCDAPTYYLVNEGSCTTGTIYYSLDNKSYSKNAPTVGGAGTYTVYYKVYEDENYYGYYGSVKVTILSRLEMEVDSNDGLAVYNGTATNGGAEVIVSDPTSGYTIRYGETRGAYDLKSIPTYTNPGTYTVYYRVTATGYYDYTGSFEIEIEKIEHEVVAPTPITGQVDCDAPSYSLVTPGSCSTGTIFYSLNNKDYSTETPEVYGAGTFKVYYKVYEDELHNEYLGYVTVTIEEKPEVDAESYDGVATYDGSATTGGAKVVVHEPSSGYTISYGTKEGVYNLTSIPKYTNPGEYTVYYRVTASSLMYEECTGSFTITINEGLNGYTWDEVASICEDGDAEEYFEVGDTAIINLDALPNAHNTTSAQTATIAVADVTDTSLTLLVIGYETSIPTNYMNISPYTNVGGWADTYMRSWLNNEYYKALSKELQNAITAHITSYSKTYDSTSVSYCEDKLWLLSVKEVLGGNTQTTAGVSTTYLDNLYTFNSETQLAYFANGNTFLNNDELIELWLRSSTFDNDYSYCCMFYSNNNYNVYNYDADNYEGVFPAFCIGYKDFSDYSWSEIQAICKDGLANEYFSVGDTKTINIDALPNASNSTSAQTATLAIGDISEDGTTMTMLVTNYSKAAPTYEMNSTDSNSGGWKYTSMRDWLNNEYLNALSSDLQNAITIHSSSYSWSYEDDEVSYCDDKVWLLSEKEVFGGDNPSHENRGTFVSETQLAYFANGNNTKMYSKNSSVWWWLRSSVADNNDEFSMVSSDGDANSGFASEDVSVFPAFTIGASFSAYSWSEIQEICEDGLAGEYFSVGETRTINIDALPNASNSTSAQTATLAIGDISEDGTTMTILVTNYSKAAPTHEMNSTDTNKGGWGSTSMRDWLNDEYLSALSNDLQNVITIHSSSYSWSYEDDEVSYCKDKIWLLSEKEVFGGYNPSYENRGTFVSETQLAYFKNIINGTTMYSKNSSVWWWLRSSVADNNDEFSMVDSDGEASSGYADENASVFPAFYIG